MKDVFCDRCGAGYRVEPILIGPEGTPIKCAYCHTVFRVFPEDDSMLRSPVVWLLRDPSGETTPFSRLGVLQQRILAGEVGPDWEMSRFGESWRRLEGIEGLGAFFERAAK
jgi:predicted Zn finger-like uncharacterized protein